MTIFDGDIYIARSDTGHYKIGISKTPQERIRHFDTIMPVSVELIHRIPSDDCKGGEALIHQSLARFRFKGEWFDLPEKVVTVLCGVTAYFGGGWYQKMDTVSRTLFELERNGSIAWTYAELPY